MNLAAFDLTVLGPALAAGLLVLSTHVPLGQQVLKRGIIFIDLAIAQVAALGVVAAHMLGWTATDWRVQIAAVVAALSGAVLLTWTERRWPHVQEALIGVLFVLAASAAIILLANHPQGGERLKELLVGQILWVTWPDLIRVAQVYGVILLLWFVLGERLGRLGFYVLFALSVTVSVQLVGLYLVFASLIIPALATRSRYGPGSLRWGYLIGLLGYGVGLVASAAWDLPSGAVVVWSLALFALLLGRFSQRDH